jgi:hypothetical protein
MQIPIFSDGILEIQMEEMAVHVSFGHYSLPSSFPLQSTNRKKKSLSGKRCRISEPQIHP